jgi:hypothetical protein
MDHLRQIRFVIGPFFFLGSILSAAILGCSITLASVRDLSGGAAAVLIAFVGASVLPLGFLLGGITALAAQLWFRLRRYGALEFSIGDVARNKIWTTLSAGEPPQDRRDDLYGGTTFELEMLNAEVVRWIDRRWNAFYASAISCMSLVLAAILSLCLFQLTTFRWFVYIASTILLSGMLFAMAWRAWHQTMRMIEFQSSRIANGQMFGVSANSVPPGQGG